jgi:SPP1 gp7 family putative phage head morphogenesis protein
MPDSPASVGFNVPFEEAIAAMEARGIALPAQYYGEFQGIQRQLNFSIAGVASLDQLQAVLDSLTAKLADGQSFKQWQDSVAVQDLGLPKHRLDNIYRTNIQNAYNRGHWEQFKENEKFAPYLMYDAINDSRTRPSHRALDGVIRRVDDPFWDTHYPANGYRCRCSVVSLSEKQAQARSNGDNGLNKKIEPDKMKPDKGWDYNCGSDITAGINKAVADKMAKAAAKTVEPKLAKTLKKKIVVPKDDSLHVDKIVAKTPADAPPKPAPKPKSEPKPKATPAPKVPAPTNTPKLASETPQDHPSAKAWSKEHIDSVQEAFPYKFQDGVFNPDLVKTGNTIKNTKTGESWSIDEAAPKQKPAPVLKPKAEPKPKAVDAPTPKLKPTVEPVAHTPKLASKTPQIDPATKAWSGEHLDKLQNSFPYKFQDGVFNSNISLSGKKLKDVLTGETWEWDAVKKEIVPGSYKNPKAKLKGAQKDPIAATWDAETLAMMKEQFPGLFDKDGNWVNPSATKPTPTAAQVKAQFSDAVKNKKTASYKNYTPEKAAKFQTALDFYGVDDSYFSRSRYLGGADYAKKHGLTELEHKAIYSYTENKVFGKLNAANGGWATHKLTNAEKDAADTFTRVLNGALDKLPEHSGVVRRDLSLTKKQLERYAVGEQVTEKHFSSTTEKMAGIDHFRDDGNTVFFFDLKKGSGADIRTMSEYGGTESEVLIKSGRSFKIESKVFDDSEDRWVVKLKEV